MDPLTVPTPAGDGGTADEDGRDRVELEVDAVLRVGRVEVRGVGLATERIWLFS